MTPTYLHFNENYNKDKNYYIVLDGSNIVTEYTRYFNKQRKKRSSIFIVGNILVDRWLLPKKRTWKNGNYEEFRYKIIHVGYKDKTTHLTAGEIYQLEKIN